MWTVFSCKEVRVVGRALKQYRESVRPLWDDDYGVEFNAIAHRYHHLTFDVVIVRFRLLPFGRNIAARLDHIAILGPCSRGRQRNEKRDEDETFTNLHAHI